MALTQRTQSRGFQPEWLGHRGGVPVLQLRRRRIIAENGPFVYGPEQIILCPESEIHGLYRDAGAFGDQLHGRGPVAEFAEQLVGLADDASVDTAIVGSVGFMFVGIAILGAATLRRKQLPGWNAWAPLLVLLAGLIAAPFYSIDKVVHFILLGLLWGSAWLFMASVGYRQQRRKTAGPRTPVPSAASAA